MYALQYSKGIPVQQENQPTFFVSLSGNYNGYARKSRAVLYLSPPKRIKQPGLSLKMELLLA